MAGSSNETNIAISSSIQTALRSDINIQMSSNPSPAQSQSPPPAAECPSIAQRPPPTQSSKPSKYGVDNSLLMNMTMTTLMTVMTNLVVAQSSNQTMACETLGGMREVKEGLDKVNARLDVCMGAAAGAGNGGAAIVEVEGVDNRPVPRAVADGNLKVDDAAADKADITWDALFKKLDAMSSRFGAKTDTMNAEIVRLREEVSSMRQDFYASLRTRGAEAAPSA